MPLYGGLLSTHSCRCRQFDASNWTDQQQSWNSIGHTGTDTCIHIRPESAVPVCPSWQCHRDSGATGGQREVAAMTKSTPRVAHTCVRSRILTPLQVRLKFTPSVAGGYSMSHFIFSYRYTGTTPVLLMLQVSYLTYGRALFFS